MRTEILSSSEEDIKKAGKIIADGGLVAFPTETVYGLGANALNEDAVKKIYEAKGRPSDNPLIVHIAKKEDIAPLVSEITPKAQALIDAFFPAPLTVILKKSNKVGSVVSGGLGTVAVRMPENETARRLIEAAGCPVAAPSANTSGLPSPTKAKYVIEDMNGKIDAIIDGEDCSVGVESTVITLASDVPTVLRPGAVTKEQLEAVIGKVEIANAVLNKMESGEKAESPGMKYKHYAPKAQVIIVDAPKKSYESFVNSQKNAFALCFDDDNVTIPKITYGRENDDDSQARELFCALRELDEAGAKKVYARIPSKSGVGMAVYNRLIRAAAFKIIDLNKPFTIGITGQTGAGKSYVCQYLQSLGFQILDADKYVKKIYESDKTVLAEIQKNFGKDTVVEGILQRKLLAKRVFSDESKTELLNSIIHPRVLELCKSDAKHPCVFDAALLFECGAKSMCFKTVSVCADTKTRLSRIMERDCITEDEALLRMNAQKSEDFYKENADFIVYNNDESNVKEQINKILEDIV